MNTNLKKAIIITRVSTQEQEAGKSKKAQLETTSKYCQDKGFIILETFPLVESSTQKYRKAFMGALEFALKHKESIAIVCDTVDRFQRSFKESVMLGEEIKSGKIELHFVRSGLKLDKNSTATELMMWDMNVMAARGANLQMRDATNRGLRQKFKDGELANKAPIGYKNVTNNGKKTVIVDEAAAPLVIRAFEEYSSGNYSMEEITRRLYKAGLRTWKGSPLTKSSIHRMLQCKFYYGILDKYGEEREHIYPKLISKEIFYKCQDVRLGYQKQHLNYGTLEHLFRNNLKCGCCGSFLSPYTKTKKIKSDGSTHQYTYLKCSKYKAIRSGSKCNTVNMREEKALNQVKDAIKALNTDESVLANVITELKEGQNREVQIKLTQEAQKKKRFTMIDTIREQLFNTLAEGTIKKDYFDKKMEALRAEEEELRGSIENFSENYNKFVMTIERMSYLINKLPALFDSSKIEAKRFILNLLFSNLEMKGEKLNFTYTKPFGLLSKGLICCELGG